MRVMEPMVQELLPSPDPWEAARCFADWPHLLFLDSALPHPEHGRYSFISADPIRWRTLRVDSLDQPDVFGAIAAELRPFPLASVPDLPPFQGGCAGLFGYGLNRTMERIAVNRHDEFGSPDLAVGFYDWVIAFDHVRQRAWLISTGYPERDESTRRERARLRQARVLMRLAEREPVQGWIPSERGIPADRLAPHFPLGDHAKVWSNFAPESYREVVRRAREYIHAGDCFQVNIAQRLLSPLATPPLELYAKLRSRNPAPFACYLDAGEFAIASASPERFLRVADRWVETRPIKGTRPRGDSTPEDEAWQKELQASIKDRAENVMIVDLLRNDLGRVCEFGTVRVPSLCEVETYPFVHHLVSSVVGRLRNEHSPLDLLRAAFPGGSVTGAPKVRAMQIIAELEPTARGPYCGCIGYIGFDGAMDSNILIRTFTAGRGWVQFPVGGGIVADSDPRREYEETLHKAEGMLRALRE